MDANPIRFEMRGHVAVLTIDRPERRNAMNQAAWDGLAARVVELQTRLPRAVVVTGAGDQAFCAGQDLNPDNPQTAHFMAGVQSRDKAVCTEVLARLRQVTDAWASLPVPTIAAVNGIAYGGGAELAVRCDLRVVDPGAVLCFSEVKLGLMPDLGGGVALTRLVGPGRAADLVLTARKVGADEALALGLVNRISSAGRVLDEALALADAIAANGPRAVRAALHVVRRTPELDDEAALALELDQAAELITTGECAHGVTAFFSRRPPVFPDVE